MHLWASHWVMWDVSGVSFITKKSLTVTVMLAMYEGFVNSDASSLQMLVLCVCSGNIKVAVMGLWSDRNVGSMVASDKSGRSFCVIKR